MRIFRRFKRHAPIILERSSIKTPRSDIVTSRAVITAPRASITVPRTTITPSRTQFNSRKTINLTTNRNIIVEKAVKKVTKTTKTQKVTRRKKLALLLPAHNEELIISATIASAIRAGMKKEDIFVVDDNSDDNTRKLVIAALGKKNILSVERSGKAKAIFSAIGHFEIEKRYLWVHVSDADSIFGEDYFRIYRKELSNSKEYAVAIGFIQSMRGNWIAHYRAFCYTYAQHLTRRWQSWFGMISVFPGPLTSFRTDIIKDLDFNSKVLAEDLDLTYQVHRKKLGKVHFITRAVNYTQDPQTLRDFSKQTMRWQRGFFQCAMKYKVGLKLHPLDIGIAYSMIQVFLYLFEILIFIPFIIYTTGRWVVLPTLILGDFMAVIVLAIFSTIVIKRWTIIASLPYFYFLRWFELCLFIAAFVEVVVFRKFLAQTEGWATEGRRYAISTSALKDTAKI